MSDEDFGFDSGDEEDVLAIVNDIDHGTKRKTSSVSILPPTKRVQLSFASATASLAKNFGLKSFRLKQEQAISRVLSGESATVVFPTGGGKSLCYQVPALCFAEEDRLMGTREEGEHGVTLVVSPLIALMKDQVDALKRKGIKAATMDSSKTREEYLATCDMLSRGELKLLYCAPERLNNEGFIQQMKYVRGGIRLLAVDEAHCISEWGHAFRPDYLKVARFVKEINAERVICLTATATPRVAKDICKAFDIDLEQGLFRTSTYRPNLCLFAQSAQTREEIFPYVTKFLRANKGATIIYVTLQKHTEELAAKLNSNGFKAKAFHAGMDTSAKTQLQDEFMRRDDLIVVATIAFGMGIDKATIRNVIHMNIPSSLESYSQEIGRAGRDGLKSNCFFYVCAEDLHLREMFARGDLPSLNSVRNLLMDIFTSVTEQGKRHNQLPVGSDIKFSHYIQEKDYDMRSTTLKNIYAQLELTHKLIRATTPIYTKYTFAPSPSYSAILSSDPSPTARAIVVNSKQAKTMIHFDLELTSKQTSIPRSELVRKLNDWSASGVIDLKPSGVLNVYKITSPLPCSLTEIEEIASSLYKTMEARETEALHRTDEMLSLITGKECFSAALAKHFGESLPEGKKECGHCQWCLTGVQVEIKEAPIREVNGQAFNEVLKNVLVRDDPRLLAKIAFGISSPRITSLGAGKSAIFGSMEDHSFSVSCHLDVCIRIQSIMLIQLVASSQHVQISLRESRLH